MPTDPLTLARDRAQENLFWRHLEVNVEDAGEGWVKLRVPVQDGLRDAVGAPVRGGVLSALVDMAVGGAVGTTHEGPGGGVGQSTLDLNVSFLAAAGDGDLFAEGRLLRRGRTIAFGEARISDASGRLVAVGRATYMLLTSSRRWPAPSTTWAFRGPGWGRTSSRRRRGSSSSSSSAPATTASIWPPPRTRVCPSPTTAAPIPWRWPSTP